MAANWARNIIVAKNTITFFFYCDKIASRRKYMHIHIQLTCICMYISLCGNGNWLTRVYKASLALVCIKVAFSTSEENKIKAISYSCVKYALLRLLHIFGSRIDNEESTCPHVKEIPYACKILNNPIQILQPIIRYSNSLTAMSGEATEKRRLHRRNDVTNTIIITLILIWISFVY